MHRIRYLLLLVLFAFSAEGLFAQTTLNAEKAVELAIKNNLNLQRTKISTVAKKRAQDRSWNSLLPSVSAASSASRANESVTSANEWTPSASLGVSMSLSPAIFSSMEQAKLDYAAGLIDYGQAKRSLELSTRKAFNQILLYKANIAIAERKIETARSQYEQTAAMANVGQASQLDALSAEVNWESLKPTMKNAVVAYEDLLDDFKLMLGVQVEETIILEGRLESAALATSLATASRAGDSAEVVALQKSLELAKAEKKVARDQTLMPTLSLSYDTNRVYSDDTWTDAGSFSVSLGLKLDGFLPWSSTQEQLDQYDDSVAAIASQITEARLASDATVRQLRRSIEKSFGSLEALDLNVRLAERSYVMFEESYKKGTSDLQSLKNAADTLVEARLSVLQENYTLSNAILDLENELNLAFGSIGNL